MPSDQLLVEISPLAAVVFARRIELVVVGLPGRRPPWWYCATSLGSSFCPIWDLDPLGHETGNGRIGVHAGSDDVGRGPTPAEVLFAFGVRSASGMALNIVLSQSSPRGCDTAPCATCPVPPVPPVPVVEPPAWPAWPAAAAASPSPPVPADPSPPTTWNQQSRRFHHHRRRFRHRRQRLHSRDCEGTPRLEIGHYRLLAL